MLLLEQTLPTAAENIALDEALIEEAEAASCPSELLRLWEPTSPLVVIGRSSRAAAEVRLDLCARLGVPVIRRASGGAAIVTGPGCLMYALVLSFELRPTLRAIDAAHRFVLSRLSESLRRHVASVDICGTSDLAFRTADASSAQGTAPNPPPFQGRARGGSDSPRLFTPPPTLHPQGERDLKCALRKFSGNSLRVKRRHMLYHGTLLYDFDLALVERLLAHPPREPQYRGGRPHSEFIANLPMPREAIKQSLIDAWQADGLHDEWPQERTTRLVAEKYSRAEWNLEGDVGHAPRA
jgi:lipoate---protein ligase